MLRFLKIENLAIIDQCEIAFENGLNILTGETGAGKSVIIGALKLILGERSSSDDIRTGAKSASVEASFEFSKNNAALKWLEAENLATDEEEIILRREISSGGRNRCFVNGHAATLQQLRDLGEFLLDLHGQHQHQSLLNLDHHISALDQFGIKAELLDKTRKCYVSWARAKQQLIDLEKDERELARLKDTLSFQLNEIDAAKLEPGEDAELKMVRDRLSNAEKLSLAAQTAYDLLYEGEVSEVSVAELMSRVEGELISLAKVDAGCEKLVKLQTDIKALVDELANELRDYRDEVEHDPGRLEQAESRLEEIKKLKRKYGESVEEILKARDEYEKQLNQLENRDEEIQSLNLLIAKEEKQLVKHCIELSKQRVKAATKFSKQMVNVLGDLQMEKTRFEVSQTRREPLENELGFEVEGQKFYATENGIDQIEFLMSPNPGEDVKPLRKIVSGGELSRIMLALKSLIASKEQVPVMIFDEIDTGISGKAAERVGDKMVNLSKKCQLICITHLPQIAAKARVHFSVKKSVENKRTCMKIERLSPELRLAEMARLLGGAEITETGIRYAEEMIKKSG